MNNNYISIINEISITQNDLLESFKELSMYKKNLQSYNS